MTVAAVDVVLSIDDVEKTLCLSEIGFDAMAERVSDKWGIVSAIAINGNKSFLAQHCLRVKTMRVYVSQFRIACQCVR